MKVKRLVCQDCGHEEHIEVHRQEEADRAHRRLVPPRCSKCGSTNVKLYD